MEKTIQEITEELFEKIGIVATVSVEKEEDLYKVAISTEENALLIGKHGNTLSSLEYVLTQLVTTKEGSFTRIIVEVGGYREEREEYLENLAEKIKQEVLETGVQKSLRGLKPWERRVVHMYLSTDPSLVTESVGEGRDRELLVSKK